MKVSHVSYLEGFRGSYKGSDLVYVPGPVRGEAYARARVKPRNPQTRDQVAARTIAKDAARCWSTLSPEARDGWKRFTQQFACVARPRRPMNVCREAQRMRLILGLPTTTEAPRLAFPPPVTGCTLLPATDPNEYSFSIEHAVDVPAGNMVLVKITRAMETVACTPEEHRARCVCGLGPQSATALPENGGVVTFTNARFAIGPGERFGAAFTVIRVEDGLASQVAFFDLIRP